MLWGMAVHQRAVYCRDARSGSGTSNRPATVALSSTWDHLFAHTEVHITTTSQISVPVQALMCPSNPGHGEDGHSTVIPAGKTLAIQLGLSWRPCVWNHDSMMLLLPKTTMEMLGSSEVLWRSKHPRAGSWVNLGSSTISSDKLLPGSWGMDAKVLKFSVRCSCGM